MIKGVNSHSPGGPTGENGEEKLETSLQPLRKAFKGSFLAGAADPTPLLTPDCLACSPCLWHVSTHTYLLSLVSVQIFRWSKARFGASSSGAAAVTACVQLHVLATASPPMPHMYAAQAGAEQLALTGSLQACVVLPTCAVPGSRDAVPTCVQCVARVCCSAEGRLM